MELEPLEWGWVAPTGCEECRPSSEGCRLQRCGGGARFRLAEGCCSCAWLEERSKGADEEEEASGTASGRLDEDDAWLEGGCGPDGADELTGAVPRGAARDCR